MISAFKECKTCGEQKSRKRDFHNQKQNRDGLHTNCKTCVSKYEQKKYDAKKLRKA